MILKIIDKVKDQVLNTEYNLCCINAIELSKYLKEKNPNYNKYNFQNKTTSENDFLNSGLYEYQNFFLYRKDDEYKLLDGFRRLLWHDNIPDRDIHVRVYENLSDSELIKLMISLNNFKFFSKNQKYYDRGFAIFLDSFFDLDITENFKIFDDYMSFYKLKNGYGEGSKATKYEGEDVAIKVIEFLTSEYFISDFKFVIDFKNQGIYHGILFTSLVRKLRGLNSDFIFNIDDFMTELKSNSEYFEMAKKYHTYDNRGSGDRDTDKVNSLIEIYENIFKKLNGEEIELTYLDKLKICKDLVSELKNKKSGFKQLTKNRESKHSENVKEIVEYIKENQLYGRIEFKVVVFPDDSDVGRWSSSRVVSDIEYGLHNDFKLEKIATRNHSISQWNELEISNGVKNITRFHNRYDEIQVMGRGGY